MRPWWPLLTVCLGSFLFLLDTTVVTVAAPRVVADLGGRVGEAAWVLNVYTLVLAMLMLPAGGWADRLGQRLAFMAGLAVFAAASLACALTHSLPWLIGFRAAQGIGGAAIAVAGFTLLIASYPDTRQRSQAMGVFFATNGLGAAVGPLVGGGLTDVLGWRAIFAINVPLAVATAALTHRVIPATARSSGRTDWPGVLSFAAAAGALTLALSNAAGSGWAATSVWAPAAAGVAFLVAFVGVELRQRRPLLDVRLFARPAFAATMLVAATSSLPFAALIYTSIWLQDGLRLSPTGTGLALMPLAGTVCLVSILAGNRLHRLPPRLPIGSGLLLIGAGALLQALNAAETPATIAPGLVLTGIGIGLIGPTLGMAVAAATPPARRGMGAGAMTTLRQLGQSLGIAALATTFTSPSGDLTGAFHATQAAIAPAAAVGVVALFRRPRTGR